MRPSEKGIFADVFVFLCIPLLTIPFRLLSSLIPKERHLWVFGCYRGVSFNGNLSAFYEYVVSNDTQVRCIVVTRSRDTLAQLRERGCEVHLSYSLAGAWYIARAGVCFVSNFVVSDLNLVSVSYRTIIVNLWHGVPIKNIRWSRPAYLRILLSIVRFQIPRPAYFLSTYDQPVAHTPEQFRLTEKQILALGYPRNDALLVGSGQLDDNNVWLYAPTFRSTTKSEVAFSEHFLQSLNELLDTHDITLLISAHPAQYLAGSVSQYSHIMLVDPGASNHRFDELLRRAALLITDYSSCAVDYALLGRPMVFYPYDYGSYAADPGFCIDYFTDLPGPFVRNENELYTLLSSYMKTSLPCVSDRYDDFVRSFHLHVDANSSERLFDYLMSKQDLL